MAGDKQSVSTLADLAKHAQIFNLQNWLHSGKEAPADEPDTDTCSNIGEVGRHCFCSTVGATLCAGSPTTGTLVGRPYAHSLGLRLQGVEGVNVAMHPTVAS